MMGSSEWSKIWCDGALLQLSNLSTKSLPMLREDSMNAGHCARPTAHDGAVGPSAERRRGSSAVGCAPCQRQSSLGAGRVLQDHAAPEAGQAHRIMFSKGMAAPEEAPNGCYTSKALSSATRGGQASIPTQAVTNQCVVHRSTGLVPEDGSGACLGAKGTAFRLAALPLLAWPGSLKERGSRSHEFRAGLPPWPSRSAGALVAFGQRAERRRGSTTCGS